MFSEVFYVKIAWQSSLKRYKCKWVWVKNCFWGSSAFLMFGQILGKDNSCSNNNSIHELFLWIMWSKWRLHCNSIKIILHFIYDGDLKSFIAVKIKSTSVMSVNKKLKEWVITTAWFNIMNFLCFRLINQPSGKSDICLRTETFLWPQGGQETYTYGNSKYKIKYRRYITRSLAVYLYIFHF